LRNASSILFVNAAERTVRHDHNNIAAPKTRNKVRDDFVGSRNVFGFTTLRTQALQHLNRRYCGLFSVALRMKQSSDYYSSATERASSNCCWKSLICAVYERGSKNRDDAMSRVLGTGGQKGFAHGGWMMREVVDHRDPVNLAADFNLRLTLLNSAMESATAF